MLLEKRLAKVVIVGLVVGAGCKHASPHGSALRSTADAPGGEGLEIAGPVDYATMLRNISKTQAEPDYAARMAESVAAAESGDPQGAMALQDSAPRGSWVVYQADILVNEADARDGAPSGFALGSALETKRWPKAIVPYAIDPALDDYSKSQILGAIQDYRLSTNIRLIPFDPAIHASHLLFTKDSVHAPEGAAVAELGYQGHKQQLVWQSSGTTFNKDVYIHEIGHALGLHHEHQRHDRDRFIDVQWDNIDPKRTQDYEVLTDSFLAKSAQDSGPYDVDSIMHYTDQAFCKRNEQKACVGPTFLRRSGGPQNLNFKLSKGDIATLASMYPKAPPELLPLRGDDGVPLQMTHANAVKACLAESYALPESDWLQMAFETNAGIAGVFGPRGCTWSGTALNAQGTGFHAMVVEGGKARRVVKSDSASCQVLCSLTSGGPVPVRPMRIAGLDLDFDHLVKSTDTNRQMRVTQFFHDDITATIVLTGVVRSLPQDVRLTAATVIANNFDSDECARPRVPSDFKRLVVSEADDKGAPIAGTLQDMIAGPSTFRAGKSYVVEATVINPIGCRRVDFYTKFQASAPAAP